MKATIEEWGPGRDGWILKVKCDDGNKVYFSTWLVTTAGDIRRHSPYSEYLPIDVFKTSRALVVEWDKKRRLDQKRAQSVPPSRGDSHD